jgi:hypothetical protein
VCSNAKVVICSHATLPELAAIGRKCKKLTHAVAIPRYRHKAKNGKNASADTEVRTHITRTHALRTHDSTVCPCTLSRIRRTCTI